MLKRALLLAFLFFVTLTLSAQWTTEDKPSGVPAYNAAPPRAGTKLPPILPKEQLWGEDAQYPYQTHAYDLAKNIPVGHQHQPRYGYCDRMRHNTEPSS